MNITFLEAVKLFYNRYTDFDGCSTRAEYWYAFLYILLAYAVFSIFGRLGLCLSGIFSLVNLIPGIALGIRRMHDIGKSGWWLLIRLIPIIGQIWYLVLAVTPTKEYGNPYRVG